jgi:hypothetical protein
MPARTQKNPAPPLRPPVPPAPAPSWLRPLLMGLTALLLLSWFTGEIADTDIWLHLKTGQHTLETRALTVPDPFSYTSNLQSSSYAGEAATRYFNLTHEWLAQSIMYLVYAVAGFPGLVLLRAAVLIGFCGLIGLMAFWRSGHFYRGLAAAIVAGGVAINFQQSRPFLVTFALLAAVMAILESRRRMWLLPAIFLFWANCHGGFFLGWVIMGAYCAEAFIWRLQKKPVPGERQLWLMTVLCFLISGVNPNGFRVIQILFLYRNSPIQANNLEWQYPADLGLFAGHWASWQPSPFSFVLFGALVALVIGRRRTRPVDWLLYAIFAPFSLLAVRNTIFMGIFGPILIAALLPSWKRAMPLAAEYTVAGLLVALVVWKAATGGAFQLRAAEWQLPSGAADFLKAHQVTERIFNTYETGGYLVWRLWPMQKDFIDPRGLSEEAYADYRRMLINTDAGGATSAQKLFDKYGIQVLVLEGFVRFSGELYALAVNLAAPNQSDWKLVYADSKGVVFMRHPPAGVQPLNSLEALGSIELQCTEQVRHDPARPRCARGIGELYAQIGDRQRARQWLQFYLDHRAEADPDAEQMLRGLPAR